MNSTTTIDTAALERRATSNEEAAIKIATGEWPGSDARMESFRREARAQRDSIDRATRAAPPTAPAAPAMAPAESTRARPRLVAGRDNDYLMRQAARIMTNGGSQADVIKYWQDVEGVKLARPVTVVQQGGASSEQGPAAPRDPALAAKGAGVLAAANVGMQYGMGGGPGVGGLSLKAIQGITFGFGDEAIGTILGYLTGEGAQAGRDIYREALDQQQKANPVGSTAAELAGGVAGGIGASAALGLPALGARLSSAARVGLTAAEAGGGGAVAGAGNTSGPISERATGALVGGVAGLLLIGAGAAAGKTAGTVARPLVRGLTQWSTRLQEAMPGNISASRTGRQLLAEAFARDGIALDAALTKADQMAATGAPVTAADVGGENVLQLLAAAAGLRGPAKQRLVEEFVTRQAEQGPRLLGSLFRALKVGTENAYDAADELFANRSAAAAPKYTQAYTQEATLGPKAKQLLKEPWAKQAYEIGRQIAGEEDRAGLARVAGALPVPPLETAPVPASTILGPSGAPVRAAAPPQTVDKLPIRGLDYMKRGLDALRESGGGDGAPILPRQQWVPRGKMLGDALDEIGTQSPTYGEARSIWKGNTDMMEALQLGKGGSRQLANGVQVTSQPFHTKPPEVIARELASLSPAEQELYRVGAFQDMADWVHGMSAEAPDVARQKFGGRVFGDVEKAMGMRLRALVKDPDLAQQLMDHVMAEARLSYSTPKMLSGSRTAPLASAMAELEGVAPGKGGIIRQAAGTALEALSAHARTGWTSAVSDELSNLATKGLRGADELIAMLSSLRGMAPPHRAAIAITAGQQVGGSSGLR